MTKEEQVIVETGMSLESLVDQPGWKIINRILKEQEDTQIDRMLNYNGSNTETINALFTACRNLRALRISLDVQITEMIRGAKEILVREAQDKNIDYLSLGEEDE